MEIALRAKVSCGRGATERPRYERRSQSVCGKPHHRPLRDSQVGSVNHDGGSVLAKRLGADLSVDSAKRDLDSKNNGLMEQSQVRSEIGGEHPAGSRDGSSRLRDAAGSAMWPRSRWTIWVAIRSTSSRLWLT